ncbi:MAG TPA: N-acetylmuramoyl-L-alanine amidase [Candidatus Solibacter sp.]|nr:N-acetylmuramoyl-L-alanine amidase [Candidatus Solibacter sp.]
MAGAILVLAALASTHSRAQSPMPPQAPGLPVAPPATQQEPQTQYPFPLAPGPERPTTPAAVTVILDPAHGGADSGAHGDPAEEGAVEKDLVLAIALTMRRELERQGVRVVLTRQSDTAVSINDRAAVANGLGAGFFVSLHVGSTGEANTAATYSFGASHGGAPPAFVPRPPGIGAVRWDDAQAAYLVASRRLAELVQVELAQKLPRSTDVPQFAEVRQLRVVAHPAVAIELSRVAEENPAGLEKTAAPLAAALVRAIAAYRQPPEGKP